MFKMEISSDEWDLFRVWCNLNKKVKYRDKVGSFSIVNKENNQTITSRLSHTSSIKFIVWDEECWNQYKNKEVLVPIYKNIKSTNAKEKTYYIYFNDIYIYNNKLKLKVSDRWERVASSENWEEKIKKLNNEWDYEVIGIFNN